MVNMVDVLCECGCGQPTRPAKQTNKALGIKKGQPRRFLLYHNRRGATHGPGRFINNNGYVVIRAADYPDAITTGTRGWIREHRLVMEMALKRPLSSREHVHHINGDKTDNRRRNLVLTTAIRHPSHFHPLNEDAIKARRAGHKAYWANRPTRLCSTPDCSRKHYGREMCAKHYMRWWKRLR